MKISKTTTLLILILIFPVFIICFSFSAIGVESDWERNYQKYVDSKEPLSKIQFDEIKELRKADQRLLSQRIPSPITLPYGDSVLQQLDIYSINGDERAPVILFIHAGDGDKINVVNAIPSWTSLGYAVVSINHRSAPKNSFPDMIEDVNRALKWVINHIQDYGGNPNRIAVTGISCGAHLAALLVIDTKSHEKYGTDISKIKCWFPMSGFYDMNLKENLISPIKPYIEWICVPSKNAASPAALATGKEPPCLIIHGGDDWCVPKTNAVSLYNRLDKERTTLVIMKGFMHANIFYSYVNPDHEPAKLIKNFLATHLPTKRNPKPK